EGDEGVGAARYKPIDQLLSEQVRTPFHGGPASCPARPVLRDVARSNLDVAEWSSIDKGEGWTPANAGRHPVLFHIILTARWQMCKPGLFRQRRRSAPPPENPPLPLLDELAVLHPQDIERLHRVAVFREGGEAGDAREVLHVRDPVAHSRAVGTDGLDGLD